MNELNKGSRIPGFYNLSLDSRLKKVSELGGLSSEDMQPFNATGGLTLDQADHMVENVIGLHALPIGIALNFIVNRREVLVPMAIEEPSVIAGASFMAKLARDGGGFVANSTDPEMIGQIQVLDLEDISAAQDVILRNKGELLDEVSAVDPVLTKLGGGVRDIEIRLIEESPIGQFLVLHLIYDVRDAMGANVVNTACEYLAPKIETLTGGRVHLRILSNLADRRLTSAKCKIPLGSLTFGDFSPEEVRDGIIEAWAFAAADPYRAATHNKGIMNGVDAVVIATGNDWRAIEAGAHSFAAKNGKYTSLSRWESDNDGNLIGILQMPMAVGIVGGATRVHPTAQAAIKLLGVQSASELAEVIVSVGLAQNLAALRALATEGIQRGHMSLHARQVALAAGATGDLIDRLSSLLVEEGVIRIDRAQKLLESLRRDQNNA